MKNYCLLITFIFYIFNFTYAQEELVWGEIPKEHLSLKACPFESDAAAMVLIDRGIIEFSHSDRWFVALKRHKRIKIFDKSANSQGNFKIRYYYKDKVKELKAQVISKDGRVTEISRDQIFKEKVSKYYKSINFALPNVQEGSIIEVKYKLEKPRISDLYEWYFQDDIPVLKSDLTAFIPKLFDYVYLFQGANKPVSESDLLTDRKFGNFFTAVNKINLSMEYIPSIKEEAFITTMDDYKNRVRFQLSTYQTSDGFVKTYMNSWEEVCEELYVHSKFGKRLRDKMNFNKAKNALQGKYPGLSSMSPLEKMNKIYSFVQNSISWDEYMGFLATDKLDQVFERKTGSIAEINLLLTALLKANDLESSPILVSTREHGRYMQLYPILDQFNYLISSVTIDGKFHVLDACDKYNPAGILPRKALNGSGFLIDGKKGKWVEFPVFKDKEKYFVNGVMDAEGNIEVDYSVSQENYSAIAARKELKDLGKEKFVNKIEENFNDSDIEESSFENVDDKNLPLKSNHKFTLDNAMTITGDLAYFSPIFKKSFSESPFKLKERTYPVDIAYPFKEQSVMILTIPDNFEVEELPKSTRYSFPDSGGSFTYTSNLNGNQLIINSDLDINRTKFWPEEYEGLKTLFEKIIEKQNEQIVFKIK